MLVLVLGLVLLVLLLSFLYGGVRRREGGGGTEGRRAKEKESDGNKTSRQTRLTDRQGDKLLGYEHSIRSTGKTRTTNVLSSTIEQYE